MKNTYSVEIRKKTWNENFSFWWNLLDIKLSDFWAWSTSDLLNNALRWKLAEFIIAHALWIDKDSFRIEWDEYDLLYKWLKIEIKSCSYIQSWEQEKVSNIQFSIKPTKTYWENELKRQSDIYIFCLLDCKNWNIINPLNMQQWKFYIVRTNELNERFWNQKSLSLASLISSHHTQCNYLNLQQEIDKFLPY